MQGVFVGCSLVQVLTDGGVIGITELAVPDGPGRGEVYPRGAGEVRTRLAWKLKSVWR